MLKDELNKTDKGYLAFKKYLLNEPLTVQELQEAILYMIEEDLEDGNEQETSQNNG